LKSPQFNNKTHGKNYLAAYRKKRKKTGYHPHPSTNTFESTKTHFNLVSYSKTSFEYRNFEDSITLISFLKKRSEGEEAACWIDVTGNQSKALSEIGRYFQIHKLLINDIASYGQRAKMDEMDNQLFTLLPMLSYNADTGIIESDQLCIILSGKFILSFHNAPTPVYFNSIKEKVQKGESPVRNNKTDYLLYAILDVVVDHYFNISRILSDQLDDLEDAVIENPEKSILFNFSLLRHRIMMVKKAIMPVREVISQLWRTDSTLITNTNKKYFKDVHDHIFQAVEYIENHREMVANLQELYMNQVNTRMNEVMKTLTIITALVVPFTVISGIYGMNFNKIPFSPATNCFLIAILCMLALSVLMLLYFKKKGWF